VLQAGGSDLTANVSIDFSVPISNLSLSIIKFDADDGTDTIPR